jgi:hypothetical protein
MIAEKVEDEPVVTLEASMILLDELIEEAEKRQYAYTRESEMSARVYCCDQEAASRFASLINNNNLLDYG